jgi:hypothetical protein
LRFLSDGRDIALPDIEEVCSLISARGMRPDPDHLGFDFMPPQSDSETSIIERLAA